MDMANKVTEFRQPVTKKTPSKSVDEPCIIFTLGDRRFAVEWITVELPAKKAAVIPIRGATRRTRKTQNR